MLSVKKNTYPKMKNEDPTLLKIRTKDDEIRELDYKTEKHDQEKISKSLKFVYEFSGKKQTSLNKKEVSLNITGILTGSGSAIGASTFSLISPGIVIVITSSTAPLTSIALLIKNEYISNLK